MLAGAWVCDVEHDQQILSSLSQKPYDETEDELLRFLVMQDSPIERIENLWATKAPVDAFLHLAHRIGRRHLEQFKAALIAVFQMAVASHKPPTADEPFVLRSKRDQETSHSDQLRNGLMTTLLHMAVLHKHAGFTVAGGDPQVFVDDLVRSIPGLSSDSTLMASLSQNLVLLAEASPRSFLEALERQLEGASPSILPIFDEHPGMITPVTYHCGLLWALEVIAWDAGYFERAVLCLAKLAAIDPGGKLSNRPINSLRAILLSWVPCTSVRTKRRLVTKSEAWLNKHKNGRRRRWISHVPTQCSILSLGSGWKMLNVQTRRQSRTRCVIDPQNSRCQDWSGARYLFLINPSLGGIAASVTTPLTMLNLHNSSPVAALFTAKLGHSKSWAKRHRPRKNLHDFQITFST
jgi:hypothetical protein